jgi:segregation and condensation protein B
MADETARAIEAILMVAQEPVEPHLLAQLLEVAPAVIEQVVTDLQAGYEEQGRGFELVKVAGGYRYQSAADLTAYVERFALEGQSARLSGAALETLAIVAYKQPLSRAQVAAIRGVNVDGVMRTLQQRGYIEEVGRDHGPGQATLFGTSREFLERLGLDSLADLPPLNELFPSADVMEALEQTLRAEPRSTEPEAVDGPATERVADGDGSVHQVPAPAATDAPTGLGASASPDQSSAASDPVSASVAGIDPFAFTDPADDPFPEPVPPAWALDPAPTAIAPVEVDADAGPAAGDDVDGDGVADFPAAP